MSYRYKTQGTCSVYIDLEIDGNIVKDLSFTGGCDGNLKGICALAKGMSCDDIKSRLSGISCGNKSTSCPDQLAKAIDEAYAASQNRE